MERSESLGDRCGGGGSIFREEGQEERRAAGWDGLSPTHAAAQAAPRDRRERGNANREYGALENYGLEARRSVRMGAGCPPAAPHAAVKKALL